MTTIAGMTAVLCSLGALFAAARYARVRGLLSAEYSRKLVHVGMGIVCLSFPWLFQNVAPVLALSVVAGGALFAVRIVPTLRDRFGCVLNGVDRRSYGEFAFIGGVVTAFVLSRGDGISYLTSVAVLTFADTLAALVGKRLGSHRFRTIDGSKSVEGSLAFLAIAIACIAIPLHLLGQPGALLIGVVGGITLMLAEAAMWSGLDNLAIPVAGTILIRALSIGLAGGAM